jgi:hypothetical protein
MCGSLTGYTDYRFMPIKRRKLLYCYIVMLSFPRPPAVEAGRRESRDSYFFLFNGINRILRFRANIQEVLWDLDGFLFERGGGG